MRAGAHYIRSSRISRLGWSILLTVGVVLVVVLFSIKTRALEAKSRVAKLERVLGQERAEIRMIKAEIAHLENPERLRSLADQYLNLQPTSARQTLTLKQAAERFAERAPRAEGAQ